MQFGFRPGRGTTDAIFIVRQLQEKYLGKKKELWMAFLDLEKAFDRVPREVVWWALRQMDVDGWLINAVKSVCGSAEASVEVGGVGGGDFPVEVGVRRGSVLGPLLFVVVVEALSGRFDDGGLPWGLLYADDLVLLAGSEGDLGGRLRRWRSGLGAGGLGVSVGRARVVGCGVGLRRVVGSGGCPCGVCGGGVDANSVECTLCMEWVHGRCGGVGGRLGAGDAEAFGCGTCVGGPRVWADWRRGVLGWMVDRGLGWLRGSAVLVMCCVREGGRGGLLGLGCGRLGEGLVGWRRCWRGGGVSLRLGGEMYDACVRGVLCVVARLGLWGRGAWLGWGGPGGWWWGGCVECL